ncbi:MAG: ECF transporter S component [Clostridia bacterium]|nr:ECF transporter S component [Clostridia bacterium]
MQETKEKEQRSLWQRLFFSGAVRKKNKSHKIAYIAVVAALCVVVNMFEIKFVDVQFSLTLAVSALAGIILGGAFGFVACFLGDLVGFLYNSSGYMYMPWIGIAMGCVALISGMLIGGVRLPVKGGVYIKLGIVSVSTFLLCTVGINTTAFWLLYAKGVPYFTYLTARLFVQGQIWNSLLNYALLFVLVPVLKNVKALKLEIQ